MTRTTTTFKLNHTYFDRATTKVIIPTEEQVRELFGFDDWYVGRGCFPFDDEFFYADYNGIKRSGVFYSKEEAQQALQEHITYTIEREIYRATREYNELKGLN